MLEHNGNNGSGLLGFDEEMCVSYLLGELSENEQERFETAYFADDVFFDRYMAVKNELLDLYSRGELDAAKQEKVRQHFSATAPRRRQLADSQQFIDAVTGLSAKSSNDSAFPAVTPPAPSVGWFPNILSLGWAAAAVLLLVAAGLWWLSSRQTPDGAANVATLQSSPQHQMSPRTGDVIPDDQPTNTDAQSNSPTVSDPPNVNRLPAKPVQTQAPGATRGLQARLVLGAVATRDISSSNTVRLSPDTSTLSIELAPGRSHKRYSASIATVDGHTDWTGSLASRPVGNKLRLVVPAKRLNRSDYILTLRGVTPSGASETVGEYYFHVVHDTEKTPSSVSPK